MIKWIVKANSWYDTMKEPNRTLFFFFVIVQLVFGTQILLTTIYGDIGYIYWSIWVMIMVLFRMVPVFIVFGSDVISEIISNERNEKLNQLGI
jgi:hypothetical protein